VLEDWLAAMPDDEASIEALPSNRVPVVPLLSIREAMEHPHLIARRTVRTINDPILREFKIRGFPLRFSGFPEEIEFDAPMLGEHNLSVLEKYLRFCRPRRPTRDCGRPSQGATLTRRHSVALCRSFYRSPSGALLR
jgi:crotonobetainyl-CoA:carnitine CoA-transferase CaiB-like acyl-CoA transferase